MRAPAWKLLSALCISTLLLSGTAAYGDGKPRGWAATTTLPGAGHGLDPEGRLDPDGAVQINIPVGYTLSEDQWLLSVWAADVGGRGVNMQAGASLGLLAPGAGLSLTPARSDRATSQTGHVQKQLWPETDAIPAVSVGILDVANEFQRSYYVAATKRIGPPTAPPLIPPVQALASVWPPGASLSGAGDPLTYGAATLSAEGIAASPAPGGPDEIIIPAGAAPALLDGMIGREWEDGAQVKLELPDGELFLLGAKHFEGVLYAVLAAPSDRPAGPGARAELHFRTPQRETAYKLEFDRDGRLRRYRDIGAGWRQITDSTEPQAFRGAAGDGGDGVWSYPVFEFAVPAHELGLTPDSGQVGFLALVELPQQPARPLADLEARQYVTRWPRGGYSFVRPRSESFEARPDAWGTVLPEATRARPGDRIGAPMLDVAPAIDGVRGEQEWAGADKRESSIQPGVTHTLHTARCIDFLYIASAWLVAAGSSFDQELHLYVDAHGDGGLLPRPDDRRFTITAQGPDVTLAALTWDERERTWSRRERIPFRAAAGNVTRSTGVESVVEVAIPLTALGLSGQAQASAAAFGLGVETAVTAVPRHAPQTGRIVREHVPSTYLTAAWGTGLYHSRVVYGVSHPVGDMRAIAEYDGDHVNVGLSGAMPGFDNARFTVGWSGINSGTRESGPLLGITYGGAF